VLYSSSGWEQQQLRRQMKCTINNSNTSYDFSSLASSRLTTSSKDAKPSTSLRTDKHRRPKLHIRNYYHRHQQIHKICRKPLYR